MSILCKVGTESDQRILNTSGAAPLIKRIKMHSGVTYRCFGEGTDMIHQIVKSSKGGARYGQGGAASPPLGRGSRCFRTENKIIHHHQWTVVG